MTVTHSFTRDSRIIGALAGTAFGDALGSTYEFQPPVPPEQPVSFRANGTWKRGEWTDDTAMAIAIAKASALGDLADDAIQNHIIHNWLTWMATSKDVGIQTRHVLGQISADPSAENCRATALLFHAQTGRSAGNGSLMRTAPVALAFLNEPGKRAQVARAVSSLTHADVLAGDACVLWVDAIARSIETGTLASPRDSIELLPEERRATWLEYINQAETLMPWDFENNGFVVSAFQAAWSAISHTSGEPEAGGLHAIRAIELAVHCGWDTDTVAAIAGSLVGAAYGIESLPVTGLRHLHGWGADNIVELSAIALKAAHRPVSDALVVDLSPYPQSTQRATLPAEPAITLGGQSVARESGSFDFIVSLSRIGTAECPLQSPHHTSVRVLDSHFQSENPNLVTTMIHVADALSEAVEEGERVLLHCVQAHTRTPSFAAAYLIWSQGMSAADAQADVLRALPHANFHSPFDEALRELEKLRMRLRP